MLQIVILTGARQPPGFWRPGKKFKFLFSYLQWWSLHKNCLNHCKYENKNFHFLPVRQNPGGCLVPARITNSNLQFYFLLYYTYWSNSCEETIDLTLKIKKFHFLPGRQPPAVTWILVWCPDLVATIQMQPDITNWACISKKTRQNTKNIPKNTGNS